VLFVSRLSKFSCLCDQLIDIYPPPPPSPMAFRSNIETLHCFPTSLNVQRRTYSRERDQEQEAFFWEIAKLDVFAIAWPSPSSVETVLLEPNSKKSSNSAM
jgi:hypothetical protein